jgi:hypothetical protein
MNTVSKLFSALFASQAHQPTLPSVAAAFAAALMALAPLSCHAEGVLYSGKISEVAASGGADTINPGTSCVKLDIAVPSASCVGGWIAIPNNNLKLLNSALAAKLLERPVALYLETDLPVAQQLHCPALAFTRCSLISVIVK